MPIVHSTNNKLLPANSRVVDVSKATINRLLPTQIRRYHNAFLVQGNACVVYNRLTNGVKCGCKSKVNAVKTRLNENGHASNEVINELLTGGHEFGILDYGSRVADTSNFVGQPSNAVFQVVDETLQKPNELFNSDTRGKAWVGSGTDNWSTDPNNPNASTVIDSGYGSNGAIGTDQDLEELLTGENEFDQLGLGLRDVACPVCFGSGYVGGFQIFNGWRLVANFQHPSVELFDSSINYEDDVPSITGTRAQFSLPFSRGGVSVDSFKVWNYNKVLNPALSIDGLPIVAENDVLNFCDGASHTVALQFSEPTTWTHAELQVNQSTDDAYLDFPKINKGSVQSKIESMQDFQIVVSPLVPLVRSNDLIADSTYAKVFHVKDVTWWNDKDWTILGWECNVRPVQPSELYSLLPKRFPCNSPRRLAQTVTNVSNAV